MPQGFWCLQHIILPFRISPAADVFDNFAGNRQTEDGGNGRQGSHRQPFAAVSATADNRIGIIFIIVKKRGCGQIYLFVGRNADNFADIDAAQAVGQLADEAGAQTGGLWFYPAI